MITFGKLTLDMPFFQAPLSGYSDQPMRLLALEYGAPLVFSGLMLDKSALYPKVLEKPLYVIGKHEHPIGGQLLGNEPEMMGRAAGRLEEFGYDLIDLNFACPVPKVIMKERGGFLLTQPGRVIEIIREVRKAISCPLILKLRIGYDHSELGREEFWQICAAASGEGVDGLVVHGRSVVQRYRESADWEVIGRVKSRFPGMTVIGSGDVYKAEDVVERLKDYPVDGVLIARGAIGNPWIFPEARALMEGKPKPEAPSLAEQGGIMRRHFEMILEQYPARKAIPYFRKFTVGYCKRHPQRKKVMMELLTAKTAEQVLVGIRKWYGNVLKKKKS
ncbi:MAG: tRNA-dihydrouridine synthase family protein [Sedimentisphaerales bacterium]|nr:tRNA-dihydrouridine synthase family protein [Sedimentisphaerales bacterium]